MFNGTSTEFNTGIPQADLAEGFSIIMRIKPTEWGNYRGLFGLHSSSNTGIVGLQYENGNLVFNLLNGSSIAIPATSVPINIWSTVAITCSAEGNTNVYINNILVATKTLGAVKPLNNLIIGRAFAGSNRFFKGKMSHLFIVKGALLAGEIEDINDYIKGTSVVVDTTKMNNLGANIGTISKKGPAFIVSNKRFVVPYIPKGNTTLEYRLQVLADTAAWNSVIGVDIDYCIQRNSAPGEYSYFYSTQTVSRAIKINWDTPHTLTIDKKALYIDGILNCTAIRGPDIRNTLSFNGNYSVPTAVYSIVIKEGDTIIHSYRPIKGGLKDKITGAIINIS